MVFVSGAGVKGEVKLSVQFVEKYPCQTSTTINEIGAVALCVVQWYSRSTAKVGCVLGQYPVRKIDIGSSVEPRIVQSLGQKNVQ